MANKKKQSPFSRIIEQAAVQMTHWVGTPWSIIIHTILFAVAFAALWFGATLAEVLLVLTTIVSLEAIYLALFIQMSVNRQAVELAEVGKDLDEISEDVERLESLEEDVEDLTEDLDRMAQEDDVYERKEEKKDRATREALQTIEGHLVSVSQAIMSLEKEIETLRNKV